MHCLIEITYEASAADALRTLILESSDKLSAALSGKRSEGYRMEGAWVALESCSAYLVIETKDGIPVYEICHELTRCAPGVKVRVIPVLPVKMLNELDPAAVT